LEQDAFGYETVFILSAAPDSSLDVPAIQARLEAMGNSVLVGGDGRMVKVHVHNERPDEVIAYGLSLGTLTRISVENLDTMADDVREASDPVRRRSRRRRSARNLGGGRHHRCDRRRRDRAGASHRSTGQRRQWREAG